MKIVTSGDYEQGTPFKVPDWLSLDHVKRYRYAQESYFQEAYSQLCALDIADEKFKSFSFVLIKPDGFPVRCVSKLVDSLAKKGFHVVAWQSFRFNRHTIRELWRYEFNLATIDRYRVIDKLLTIGDSLLVLLHNDAGDRTDSFDASCLLSELKGKSDPAARSSDSIRSEITARPGNLNHIHSPDEFIEFIRELGVLFNEETRAEIFNRMKKFIVYADKPDINDFFNEVEKIYSQYIKHDLLPEPVAMAGAINKIAKATEILQQLDSIEQKDQQKLWDLISLANEYIEVSVPNVIRILDFECTTEYS